MSKTQTQIEMIENQINKEISELRQSNTDVARNMITWLQRAITIISYVK